MFSKFLRKAIEESGKTQKVIADAAEITQAALANYLNGSRSPQIEVAEKLCKACGYTITFVKESTFVGKTPLNSSETSLTEDEILQIRALLKERGSKNVAG